MINQQDPNCDLCLQVGNTPLVQLTRVARHVAPVEVYGRPSGSNPSGSVKDRAGLNIIRSAEADGRLTHDKIILDATSGNMGIAYAMLGASLGYKVRLTMPLNVSPERKHILRAYGAEMVFTDPMLGGNGAIRRRRTERGCAGAILLRQPVRQRRQLARALPDHCRGKSGARPRAASTHFVTASAPAAPSSAPAGRPARAEPAYPLHLAAAGFRQSNAIEGWKYMAHRHPARDLRRDAGGLRT